MADSPIKGDGEKELEIMAKYLCWDQGGSDVLEIDAEDARKAARAYVDGGDWGEIESTIWVRVWVAPVDDPDNAEQIRVTLHPEEPDCEEAFATHDWRSPYAVVGGIESNPGVYGHGGGVVITEVCCHCGVYRVTDTWAQDRETGEQGLRSIEYREPDEASEQWVASRRPAEPTE